MEELGYDTNLMPEPTSDADFRKSIIKYFLGDDWYVTDPLGQEQINTCALFSIKSHYKGINSKNKLGRAISVFIKELKLGKAIRASFKEFKKE